MMVISAFQMFRSEAAKLAACAVLAAILAWPLRKAVRKISLASAAARLRKLLRWEFWPPALFYIPVGLKYLSLALKYRSLSLPALSNPGMHTGGLIGESKYETLRDLARCHSNFVAETHLVPFQSAEQQLALIRQIRRERSLEFPLVFKPDIGQRGFGFRLIRCEEDERLYVEHFSRDLLIQRYVPGPHEAGIFYYRFPTNRRVRSSQLRRRSFPPSQETVCGRLKS